MITVSVAEAKDRLPQLLRAVEAGERVVIARHGKAVAEIGSPAHDARNVFSLEAVKVRQAARGLSQNPTPVPLDFDEIAAFSDAFWDQVDDPRS